MHDRPLRRGMLLGAPLSYALGLCLYGGLGYWAAGTAGCIIGCVIATIFAIVGLRAGLRLVRAFEG